ncbi:MAG: S8 family serine peptidase [Phycisphaerales bacterium]
MLYNTTTSAVIGVLVACGNAHATTSPNVSPASQPGAQLGTVSAAAQTRIANAMRLQPGDLGVIASAQTMSFQSVAQEQEFTGELIARAKRPSALRAMDRVSPMMQKKSKFADEVVISVPPGVSEGEMAGVLMATGDYEFVEPNWRLFPVATVPNDPQYGNSWQHTRMQSAAAWDITQGSSDVIVAVCDSGVDSNHPDLQAALVPGYNAVNNRAAVDGGETEDLNGHGTFVSGCAAAIGNNGTGVVGVGWNMRVMPIRVSNLPGGGANAFDILEGGRWAASNGAKVVNASYSGATSTANDIAARDIKALGGLLFWASGNNGSNITNGNYPNLIIVGSTTSSDTRAGSSNYGNALDIVAPGASVRSTRIGGGYGGGSGTSYASPMAAGVAAMIFSANPELSPDDTQDVLMNSNDDLGSAGYDIFYGNGRVNTFKAVTNAQAYTPRLILPFEQDFESATWQDQFVATTGTVETVADPDAPSGSEALAIDAGEVVESVPLAGAATLGNDYFLSFSARSEGVPVFETIRGEYLADDGTWALLFEAPSPGGSGQYATFRGELPSDFSYHSTKVRLVAANTAGRWIVDDFSIAEGEPVALAPFNDSFNTGELSTERWEASSSGIVEPIASNFVLSLTNDGFAETVRVPTLDVQSLDQWAWFVVTGDGLETGDAINVEYRSEILSWTSFGVIDISNIAGTPRGFEFKLPVIAAAQNEFQFRVTASTGGGQVYVDDVNIGTSRLPDLDPGCSPADLVEPFGTLNFFDISAFITLYNAGDDSADLAEPFGTLNFFDISEFIGVYNSGCP